MQSFGNLDIHLVNYLTNKETSKGWVCDNFPRQFHFVLGAIHEKHKFKYFKNLTVKVCKIWCNDAYMYILQCDIFWWKLIDRNFLNPIFNTKVVLRPSPFFAEMFPTFNFFLICIMEQLCLNTLSAKVMHIYFWLKGNILAFIHLRVLLLNKYEISSISEYPVWRSSRAKQWKLQKRVMAWRPPWY
jgi:hypothetical protein